LILLYNAIDRGTTGDATTLIYCIQRDVFAQWICRIFGRSIAVRQSNQPSQIPSFGRVTYFQPSMQSGGIADTVQQKLPTRSGW